MLDIPSFLSFYVPSAAWFSKSCFRTPPPSNAPAKVLLCAAAQVWPAAVATPLPPSFATSKSPAPACFGHLASSAKKAHSSKSGWCLPQPAAFPIPSIVPSGVLSRRLAAWPAGSARPVSLSPESHRRELPLSLSLFCGEDHSRMGSCAFGWASED